MSAKASGKSSSEKKRSAKSYSAAKTQTARSSGSYSQKMLNTIKLSQDELNQLIARKAYELYESRGYQHGRDLEDWIEAEKIVTSQAV